MHTHSNLTNVSLVPVNDPAYRAFVRRWWQRAFENGTRSRRGKLMQERKRESMVGELCEKIVRRSLESHFPTTQKRVLRVASADRPTYFNELDAVLGSAAEPAMIVEVKSSALDPEAVVSSNLEQQRRVMQKARLRWPNIKYLVVHVDTSGLLWGKAKQLNVSSLNHLGWQTAQVFYSNRDCPRCVTIDGCEVVSRAQSFNVYVEKELESWLRRQWWWQEMHRTSQYSQALRWKGRSRPHAPISEKRWAA